MTREILFGSSTDVGRIRSRNEDALAVDAEKGWVVLADGMGGHAGGKVASNTVVSAFIDCLGVELKVIPSILRATELLKRAAYDANRILSEKIQETPEYYRMGSTLVAVIFLEKQFVCAHLGDSRLYRLRNGELKQLTTDHTVGCEMFANGDMEADEIDMLPGKNLLTRALGGELFIEPEIRIHELCPGDCYLLCSDGLTGMLSDESIRECMEQEPQAQAMASRLVSLANEEGGVDNISVIVAKVVER